jgi:hypothetical protein
MKMTLRTDFTKWCITDSDGNQRNCKSQCPGNGGRCLVAFAKIKK